MLAGRAAAAPPLRLHQFIREGWHVIEPATPFVDGMHIDAICDHLEAVAHGRIRNLLITIPPRMMKSLCTSVFFPAWSWTITPELRFMCASYSENLALGHAVIARNLMMSDWYQSRWGGLFGWDQAQNLKSHYANDRHGFRISVGFSGTITGRGADILICDDAHNLKDIHSEPIRTGVVEAYRTVWPSRLNEPKKGRKVTIMQRGHEDDVAALCMQQGDYEHLNLPMEYEPTRQWYIGGEMKEVPVKDHPTSIGFVDPRTTPGELLCEERFGAAEAAAMKKMGSYHWATQFQQRPSPQEGGIIKRAWLVENFYRELPAKLDEIIQSWDMSFLDHDEADFVVGQLWGRKGADRYLIKQTRGRMSFIEAREAVRTMSYSKPYGVLARKKLVEKAANGIAIVNSLRREIPGLVERPPEGSKESRLHAVSGDFEAGNVHLPDPSLDGADWVDDYIQELCVFPNGANDDQVDASTQALMEFKMRAKKPLVTS